MLKHSSHIMLGNFLQGRTPSPLTIWVDALSHPGSYRWLVCRGLCTTPRDASPYYHWFITKSVTLEGVAGRERLSTATPDSHTSLTYAQGACEHLWREQGIFQKNLPILVFSENVGNVMLCFPPWSLYMTVWTETCTSMSVYSSFCSAPTVPFLLAQGADNAPTAVLMPFYGPSTSPGILTCLLVSSLCSWHYGTQEAFYTW